MNSSGEALVVAGLVLVVYLLLGGLYVYFCNRPQHNRRGTDNIKPKKRVLDLEV